MEVTCSICSNPAPFRLKKGNTDYYQCESCHVLFSEPLNQEGLVGGEHELGRNQQQNHIRLDRIATMTEGIPKEEVWICDFGCGHGMLVDDIRKAGYNCDGYDAYNPDFQKLPEKNKYHIVMCVEIIEHCSPPYVELDVIHRALRYGGLAYFESGFVDIAARDGIALQDYIYVAPQCGHATIFSHHSFDLLLLLKSFRSKRHFDFNTRLYIKIT